jgi:hypothetical protein
MTETVGAIVAQFESAAKEAHRAEMELRKQLAEQLSRLERERAFAFRRSAFVRLLATSATSQQNEDEAAAAQGRAVAEELGWDGKSKAHEAILEEIKPLGGMIWRLLQDKGEESGSDVAAKLAQFEVWFQEKHGTPFYTLFDQYVPEAPLVDF